MAVRENVTPRPAPAPRSKLSRARWLEIRSFAVRNFALRLIALVLAAGLWVFVNAGQHEAETSMQVPVDYSGLPGSMMIVNPHPEFINLQISGPRTLLSLLDPSRLTLRLDLRGTGPGRVDFKIGPQLFSIPRQTSIERISPSDIVVDVDQLVTRALPVKVAVAGTPPAGFKLGSIDARPPVVTVTGPRRDLDKLEAIETEPLEIKDLTSAELSRMLRLVNPGGLLKVSTEQVLVTARLTEVQASREFLNVPIRVRDVDATMKFRLNPSSANLTVRGPMLKLNQLRLDSIFIDARGAGRGVHEIPLTVELPAGLELMHQSPEKVRLRVLSESVANRS